MTECWCRGSFALTFALASYPIALKLGNEYLPDIAPDLVLSIDEKFPLEKTKKGEIMDVPEDKGFTLKEARRER